MSIFQKAEWEPYVGPQGGSGWRNVENGEVIYDDEPPGGVDLPQEFEEEGLELFTDVSVENIDENDVLLAVEDGEIVARPAEDLSANSEWFGVLEEVDDDSDEEYEEYFSEGDEVDLDLNQFNEDEPLRVEDATVTETHESGLFVEYTHPESGYNESHHVPWDEVAQEELESGKPQDEVTQDPSSLTPGAEIEIQIGADTYQGEVTESLGDEEDWDYRFESEEGEDFYVFEDDIQNVLEDGEIEEDELSMGEWEGRDPTSLEEIPEGTEISLEIPGQDPIIGEYEGEEGELISEFYIDGMPVVMEDLLQEDTELYVNEESIPDGDESTESDIEDLLEEDPVITQQISENIYGDALIQEAVDVWDLPKQSYDVDPAAILIEDLMDEAKKIPGVEEGSDYANYTLGGFLKELPEHTMPGDVHSLLEAAENQSQQSVDDLEEPDNQIPEEEQITSGQFDWKNVENVPEGTYVEMMSSGDEVEGTVVGQSNLGVEVEKDDGSTITVAPTSITSGVAYEERPEDFNLSDSPDRDEIFQLAQRFDLDSTANKTAVGSFMAELVDKNVSGQDVYDAIVEVSGSDPGPADSLLQKMVESSDTSKFSETLDEEVPLARDRSVQGEINKRATKMFEENNPEYAEYTSEIKEVISSWSGNSKNPETAPLWAVAFEDGESNIPQRVADRIDAQDPEMVDATRAYIEETRKVMKDMFGDSVEVYRGISGSTGTRNAEIAEDTGGATVDHRAIASWSICPDTAKGFAHRNGSIVSKEIDIDEIYASFSNAAGFSSEFEIVAAGGIDDYEYVDDPSEGFEAGNITTGENYDDEELFVDSFEQFQELLEG